MTMDTTNTKRCCSCGLELPLDAFGRDSSKKDGLRSDCRACHSKHVLEARKARSTPGSTPQRDQSRKNGPSRDRRTEAKARSAKWRAEHPEKHRANSAKWRAEHPEKHRAKNAKWRAEHPDEVKAYNAKWNAEHPEEKQAHSSKRRALKLGALPPWFSEAQMNAKIAPLFAEAKRLEAETGIPHHVDHIMPICALGSWHAPFNLRAIPATENLSKTGQDKLAKKQATQDYTNACLSTPESCYLHHHPLPGPYDPEAYLADDGASAEAFMLDHGLSWLVGVLRALPSEQLAGLMSVLAMCPYLPEELAGADPEELMTAFEAEIRANDLRIQQLLALIAQLTTNDNQELPMAA